jgi:hypothetical protein
VTGTTRQRLWITARHPMTRNTEPMIAWTEWVMSPGFGGFSAVVAAVIAYGAARLNAAHLREATRHEQWWVRASWALDLTLSERAVDRSAGFEALRMLHAGGQWEQEHDTEMIDAITEATLKCWLEEETSRRRDLWWKRQLVGRRR